MWPPVMELFQYGPHRCRLSVVAGVLGGTHCESVWSRFGMVMLRPFYESCDLHFNSLVVKRAKWSPFAKPVIAYALSLIHI